MEITHNWKEDTYHAHVHMILAVKPVYFREGYITHKGWMHKWRDCMELDYDPWVYVRTVKPRDPLANTNVDIEARNEKTIEYSSAIAEMAKYTTKPSAYLVEPRAGLSEEKRLKMIDMAVWIMDASIAGRRMCSYGGVLRKVHKLLNLDDPVDGDLNDIDGEEIREDLAYLIVRYRWNYALGNYFLTEVEEKKGG